MSRLDPDRALEFAIAAHGAQRYGEAPYETHLRAVVRTVAELGWEQPLYLAVAALHDVLEDTSVSAPVLEAEFGEEVARAVSELTRREGVAPGAYLGALSPVAFVVKCADRLANVRALGLSSQPAELERHRDRLLPKYQREQAALRARAGALGDAAERLVALVDDELIRAAERLG